MSQDEGISTLLQSKAPGSPTATATFRLWVESGPDAGKEIRIDGTQPSRVLVGTSPACGFRLTDRQVSRRHAAIDVTPEGLRLADLGSTNGTWANGLFVIEVRLTGAGDVLRLGDDFIRVEIVAAPAEHSLTPV